MQLPSLGSIAGAAGNTLKDNVGVIEKAIIEVIDRRDRLYSWTAHRVRRDRRASDRHPAAHEYVH